MMGAAILKRHRFVQSLWASYGVPCGQNVDPGESGAALVQINKTEWVPSTSRPLHGHSTIWYEPNEFKSIRARNQHDNHYLEMPFGCTRRLRQLKINRKRSKQ